MLEPTEEEQKQQEKNHSTTTQTQVQNQQVEFSDAGEEKDLSSVGSLPPVQHQEQDPMMQSTMTFGALQQQDPMMQSTMTFGAPQQQQDTQELERWRITTTCLNDNFPEPGKLPPCPPSDSDEEEDMQEAERRFKASVYPGYPTLQQQQDTQAVQSKKNQQNQQNGVQGLFGVLKRILSPSQWLSFWCPTRFGGGGKGPFGGGAKF